MLVAWKDNWSSSAAEGFPDLLQEKNLVTCQKHNRVFKYGIRSPSNSTNPGINLPDGTHNNMIQKRLPTPNTKWVVYPQKIYPTTHGKQHLLAAPT
jgi:hypothetical protein